ncbi:MAG TPA: hypothetical protein VG184_05195 [Acidimicrobiales bacterium]|jgi:hypothetical protein|nr:hypothetical protein [Acidimicrobiales bacterium]
MSLAAGVVVGTATWLPASSLAGPIGAGCAAAATGSHVAFVVDFGGPTTSPGNVVQACVEVPSGDNNAQALADLSNQEGWPPPRYDPSGLLCAIDGTPASGCGTLTAGGYDYWSYWQGTAGGWSYSNTGPAFATASAATTQGWRFQDPGHGNPSDPAPRGPADPAVTCGTTAPSPTAASTTVPAATSPTVPPPGPSSPASSPPSGASNPAGTAAVAAGAGGGSSPSAPAQSPPTGDRAGKAPRPPAVSATVASSVAAPTPKQATGARTTLDAPTTSAPAGDRVSNVGGPRAVAGASGSLRRTGGSAWPALLTAALLAALAAGVVAYQRRHRRRGGEVG